MPLRYKWSETQDSVEWDDFVTRNAGSVFHLWSWRNVLEGNGSKPLYLACRDPRGRAVAVCPFFYMTSRHLQHLVSLPHSHMAGPILDREATDASQIVASLRRGVRFPHFKPVATVTIKTHQNSIIQPMVELGFHYDATSFGLFILDLYEKTPEHIWCNGFRKHDRQAVKYYEQTGWVLEFARSESDYLNYLALQEGTTARQKERADFLARMRLNLGDRLKVAMLTLKGKVIAGFPMLCDTTNSTLHLAHWVTVPPYTKTSITAAVRNIHSPVTYSNWKTINWAHEHGFRYVDFGGDYQMPMGPFSRVVRMFEASMVPSYLFTFAASKTLYSIAKATNQVLYSLKNLTWT